MTRYTETETYGQPIDWFIGTAKRNPEALLVLAAGCALMMRSSNSSSHPSYTRRHDEDYYRINSEDRGEPGRWGEGLSRTAQSAAEYASDVKDRIADTSSAYASSVSDYAEQTARFANRAQSTIQTGAGAVLREQPLVVAVLGVAAGAALAALFPSTKMEERTLGPTRDAIADAAGKTGENLMEAVGEAGQRLKEGAAERGLSADGLKDLASEAADAFTSKMSDEAESGRSRRSGR